jgi:four helix bundle protein
LRVLSGLLGSASELDYHLLLCRDLAFLGDDQFKKMSERLTEIRKMLTAFLGSVEEQIGSASKIAAKA